MGVNAAVRLLYLRELDRFSSNVMVGGWGFPLFLNKLEHASSLDCASSYVGNAADEALVGQYFEPLAVQNDAYVQSIGVPYRIRSPLQVRRSAAGQVAPRVVVAPNVLLFSPSTWIEVGGSSGGASFWADGAVFTSAGAQVPGVWGGISYLAGASGSLRNSEVGFAGGNGFGNVRLDAPGIDIVGAYVHDSASFGIHCAGGCAAYPGDTTTGNTFSANAMGDRN